MNKLDICLSQSDYSVRYGCPVEKLDIRGGHSRYIKKTNTKRHIVDVGLKVQREDFSYFRAFYQNWQVNPEKFLIDLIVDDSDFREYEAVFVKESVSMSFKTDLFSVSFQLIVFSEQVRVFTSLMYPFEFDEYIETSSGMLDARTRDLLNTFSDSDSFNTSSSIQSAKFISPLNVITNSDNSVDGFVGSIDKDNIKTISSIISVKYIDTLNQGFATEPFKTYSAISSAKYRDALITRTIDIEKIGTTSTIVSAKILT